MALKRGQDNNYLGTGHRDAFPAVTVKPSYQGPCNVLSATPHPGTFHLLLLSGTLWLEEHCIPESQTPRYIFREP